MRFSTAILLGLLVLHTTIAKAQFEGFQAESESEGLHWKASDKEFQRFFASTLEEVRNTPDDDQHPAQLMNLVMHARIRGNHKLVEIAEKHLLLGYADSLEAAYVRATIEKQSDYRKRILEQLNAESRAYSPALVVQISQALEQGLERYGNSFLKDASIATLALLVGKETGNFMLSELSGSQIAELKEEQQDFYRQMTGETSNVDKYLAINNFEKIQARQFLKVWFYNQLSAEDRQARPIVKQQIYDLLDSNQLEPAMAHLDQLIAEEPTAQLLFWRAWARQVEFVGKKDFAAVAEMYREVTDQFPDSREAEMARTLLQYLPQQERLLAEQMTEVWQTTLKTPAVTSGAEMDYLLEIQTQDRNWDVRVRFDRTQPLLEIVATLDGNPVLAYQTTDRESQFYFEGNREIEHFSAAGTIPFVEFQYNVDSAGKDLFNFNANFSSDSQTLQHWGPHLAGNLQRILGRMAMQTMVSNKILVTNLRKVDKQGDAPAGFAFDLLRYQLEKNELQTITCHFDEQKLFRSISWDGQEHQLQLSRIVDASTPAPVWPKLPKNEHSEFDFSAFQSFMTGAFSLVQKVTEENKPDPVAEADEKGGLRK